MAQSTYCVMCAFTLCTELLPAFGPARPLYHELLSWDGNLSLSSYIASFYSSFRNELCTWFECVSEALRMAHVLR